jgi:hypothetical protein
MQVNRVLSALVMIVAMSTGLATRASSAPAHTSNTNVPADPIVANSFDDLPAAVRAAIERGDAITTPMTAPDNTARASIAATPRAAENVQPGNCGFSFIDIVETDPGVIDLKWGFFGLCFRATSWSWTWGVDGPSGAFRGDAGGSWLRFRRQASGHAIFLASNPGDYIGCMTATATNAVGEQAGGFVCDGVTVTFGVL